MMRVGVITFHFVPNWGAVLQAYALCRVLQDMGHEVQLIDYRSRSQPGVAPDATWGGWVIMRKAVRELRRYSFSVPRAIRERRLTAARFEAFMRENLPLTAHRYHSEACFEAWPLDLDAYVCGSDQIWNPYARGFDPAFFLGFVRDDRARLVAYAPSFGAYSLGSAHDVEMARLIKRFHALSAREREGCSIISALSGREAEHVLDPTLLLDDYSSVRVAPDHEGDFVVVYSLEATPQMIALVAQAKRRFRLPVVAIGLPLRGADVYKPALRPEQWLGYIESARFVCTNSLHGTALSVLLRKEFMTAPRSSGNVRIVDLLERLGLADRLARTADEVGDRLSAPVRHEAAHERIGQLRRASLDYLRRSLSA